MMFVIRVWREWSRSIRLWWMRMMSVIVAVGGRRVGRVRLVHLEDWGESSSKASTMVYIRAKRECHLQNAVSRLKRSGKAKPIVQLNQVAREISAHCPPKPSNYSE